MTTIDNSTYWIIAVPNHSYTGKAITKNATESADDMKQTRRLIESKTQKLSEYYEFSIPKLRVGTLDALMSLSDELGRIDTQLEGTVKKLDRTYVDLKENEPLMVEGNRPEAYVQDFKWNAAKYPINATLAQLTTKIQQDASVVEEELRKRTARFSEIQQTLGAIERKESGTLLVKPLNEIVNPKDLIDGDFLTSLLLVIPKAKENDFLARYESMEEKAAEAEKKADEERKAREGAAGVPQVGERKDAKPKEEKKAPLTEEEKEEENRRIQREIRAGRVQNIVPRSAKKLSSDAEFVLYRIVILKKGEEAVKNLCRQERYTVRQYQHDPSQAESEKQSKNELTQEKNKVLSSLIMWSETAYSDVFSSWIHLKAIRVFVESVLRFGIPVNFQAAVLKPAKGARPRLRKMLQETFGFLAGKNLTSTEDDKGAEAVAGVGSEFYPYVYITVSLDDAEH